LFNKYIFSIYIYIYIYLYIYIIITKCKKRHPTRVLQHSCVYIKTLEKNESSLIYIHSFDRHDHAVTIKTKSQINAEKENNMFLYKHFKYVNRCEMLRRTEKQIRQITYCNSIREKDQLRDTLFFYVCGRKQD